MNCGGSKGGGGEERTPSLSGGGGGGVSLGVLQSVLSRELGQLVERTNGSC